MVGNRIERLFRIHLDIYLLLYIVFIKPQKHRERLKGKETTQLLPPFPRASRYLPSALLPIIS